MDLDTGEWSDEKTARVKRARLAKASALKAQLKVKGII
jgi:hypothetical protein